MEMIIDVLADALADCLKMLPFLFVAFLLIEGLEHYSTKLTRKALEDVDKAGPVVGALVGCVPQCGFSVMASNLYAGGIISVGTLLSVFLASSHNDFISSSSCASKALIPKIMFPPSFNSSQYSFKIGFSFAFSGFQFLK